MPAGPRIAVHCLVPEVQQCMSGLRRQSVLFVAHSERCMTMGHGIFRCCIVKHFAGSFDGRCDIFSFDLQLRICRIEDLYNSSGVVNFKLRTLIATMR
mmetsp:Transcript_25482/g.56049  ORF Transcript_25482/g.56049 Transcript_25482/m.56049 type:complete len:98 (+) Transcript_25482:258-551(+)